MSRRLLVVALVLFVAACALIVDHPVPVPGFPVLLAQSFPFAVHAERLIPTSRRTA